MGHLYRERGATRISMPGPIAEPRPWRRAALWLLGLGLFFFASYNAANWLASQRAHVPSIVFAWEALIPYWPWSIVPYWSIDAFYAASLFVCTTRGELDTHAKRLLAAQIVSVTIFVIAPLQCTLTRPVTSGFYGTMLDALLVFDKPYNQAPALHISLLVILWVFYARQLSGVWRGLLHVWFTLIALSVLTTYQHHFFDLPTGAWTGMFCLWLFPDDGTLLLRTTAFEHDAQRHRLALRYLSGAVVVALLAILLGGWALWLLWIAGSLLLVTWIYAFSNAGAFQKHDDGRMGLASTLLFAPYRIGARLNARWWTRNAPHASAVTPQLWIGRLPAHAHELPQGVNAVVDMCAELPCTAPTLHYRCVPALDLLPLTTDQLTRAAEAIERSLMAAPVLVCCALGYSRSAAAITAWLIISGHAASVEAAISCIRAARPMVIIGEAQRQKLEQLLRKQRGLLC
jgi:protein-tyrosine phosphatase